MTESASAGSGGRPARLAQVRPGDRCVIIDISGEASTVRRLMELGLVRGTTVRVIRRAPLGDPVELVVRGTHLSIRRAEAERIHVDAL